MNEHARKFTQENLPALCLELQEWDKTGMLGQGKIRELAALIYAPRIELTIAAEIIKTAAVKTVTDGIRTSPRTIQDEINDYQKTPEAAKELIRKLGGQLIDAKCPNCGTAIPFEFHS